MIRLVLPLMIAISHAVATSGHEMPDGEIDRRVQIVVKPDRVLVEYSLAMNGATLDQELIRLGQKPAETLSAKWKQYRDVIMPSLAKHLRVTLDGERSMLQPVRADHSGWSHLNLTCLLKTEIDLSERPKTIVVTDQNFVEDPGSYRIAMKSRSGVTIDKSNVEPIITKAKPVRVTELKKQKKLAAMRAQAEFALEPSR